MKPLDIHAVHTEGVELTLQSLLAYWGNHQHFAIAWSGGKDSTALLTLVIHLIDAGLLPQPEVLHVFYADTRLELPPIQMAAEQIMAKLALRNWIQVHVVCAPLDKRFMVYILGRGVPPPNNNTLRWCTRQIKVEPMAAALAEVVADLPGTALMLTGVREPNDTRGHLPRTFMSLAPGAHDPNTWDDVVRMRTLNAEQVAKGREKHVCPLQFDIVDRLIDRFSMPDDLVYDPFCGLGTVPMRAIMKRRRGRGSELNPDYWAHSVRYLQEAEKLAAVPTLFGLMGIDGDGKEAA